MITNQLSHVAFILDGNKRWAKKNNLPSINGYKEGFNNIKKIVKFSVKKKISNLTLFTLSTENFNRPTINLIYEIIYNNFNQLFEELINKQDIKINIFGSKENLPNKILKILNQAEMSTSNNTILNLNIAFNYGFKQEIKGVLKKFKNNIENYNLDNDNDIRELFLLNTGSDPDILIRTGGYRRLSNFIMYNLTYTELFFTDTLWPEFSIDEYEKIIKKFLEINRKYGL